MLDVLVDALDALHQELGVIVRLIKFSVLFNESIVPQLLVLAKHDFFTESIAKAFLEQVREDLPVFLVEVGYSHYVVQDVVQRQGELAIGIHKAIKESL